MVFESLSRENYSYKMAVNYKHQSLLSYLYTIRFTVYKSLK